MESYIYSVTSQSYTTLPSNSLHNHKTFSVALSPTEVTAWNRLHGSGVNIVGYVKDRLSYLEFGIQDTHGLTQTRKRVKSLISLYHPAVNPMQDYNLPTSNDVFIDNNPKCYVYRNDTGSTPSLSSQTVATTVNLSQIVSGTTKGNFAVNYGGVTGSQLFNVKVGKGSNSLNTSIPINVVNNFLPQINSGNNLPRILGNSPDNLLFLPNIGNNINTFTNTTQKSYSQYYVITIGHCLMSNVLTASESCVLLARGNIDHPSLNYNVGLNNTSKRTRLSMMQSSIISLKLGTQYSYEDTRGYWQDKVFDGGTNNSIADYVSNSITRLFFVKAFYLDTSLPFTMMKHAIYYTLGSPNTIRTISGNAWASYNSTSNSLSYTNAFTLKTGYTEGVGASGILSNSPPTTLNNIVPTPRFVEPIIGLAGGRDVAGDSQTGYMYFEAGFNQGMTEAQFSSHVRSIAATYFSNFPT
jgi:hypothetical protein